MEFVDKRGRLIRIREFELKDLDEVVDLLKEFDESCLGFNPKDSRDFVEFVYRRGKMVVAEHSGVVGVLFLIPVDEFTAELCMFVSEGYRGAGIGSAMLSFALSRCEFEKLYAVTDKRNETAIRLFEKFGFVIVKENFEVVMMRPPESDAG